MIDEPITFGTGLSREARAVFKDNQKEQAKEHFRRAVGSRIAETLVDELEGEEQELRISFKWEDGEFVGRIEPV